MPNNGGTDLGKPNGTNENLNQVFSGNTEDGFYQKIVENHPDLICKWLPDGTLTFANKTYCQYFGKSQKELVGKTCLDYIHPEDQEFFSKHLAKLREHGTQESIVIRIINPQGEVRWQQWIDKYIYHAETGQAEFLSTGRDITALKKTELELKRRVDFERLITNLSINFINIPPSDLDQHINRILSKIGQFAKVDRSYVFVFDDQQQYFSNTNEWCNKGIEPQKQNLQYQPLNSMPWLMQKLRKFETIHIPKVVDLPRKANKEKKILQLQNIQSLIIVPLVNAGSLLGFVGFDSVTKVKIWTNDESTILRIVGGTIGSAISQIRNTKELARRKSYLEKLNQITVASLTANNVEEMLNTIVKQIDGLIQADYCSIYLWNEKFNKISYTAGNTEFISFLEKLNYKPEEQSLVASILKSRKAFIQEDTSKPPYLDTQFEQSFPAKTLIGVPMNADNKKLGVVMFAYKKAHRFDKEIISLVTQATSQIAHALLKMNLLEQTQRYAQEAETLVKTGTIVASTLEPEIAIQRILDQLGRVVPFDSASVQILYDGYLEIKAGKGWPPNHNPLGIRFQVPDNNPNSQVIQLRQPYVLNDAPEQFDIFKVPHHANIRSWMGVPLLVHDRVIGMLTLDHHLSNFYDDPHLIDLATTFADQVAISLENARLYAEEHKRVKELDALRATTADISRELALENLLTAILERATALLNATGGELGLIDNQGEHIQILVSYQMGSDNAGTNIKLGEGLMGYVAQTKSVEMIEDYRHWPGRLDTYKESKIHAAIAAPLMIGNRFLGVIGVMNSDRKRKFTDSESSLMSLFAQQAAIAVENAKLYEESKRQARIDLTTGVYNRRGLYEMGQRELDRANRYERPLAAIMLDIDHFKKVNDAHGHPVGDLVLRELTERLSTNLRTIDVLSRYGGEEFVILLPETTVENASDIAERLRVIVAKEPFIIGSLIISITISLGIALTTGEVKELEELLKHADQAMYQSKRAGRNLVKICDYKLGN